jgi:hypothetical protein
MGTASRKNVLAATRQWLNPTIHVLIRSGITWREFAEIAKTVYAEVVIRHFGKRGRPTNISRASVLTGLSRREIRKLRDQLGEEPEAMPAYVTKASLVLSAWHLDPQFRDASGKPALLPLEGEGATFESLLRRCGAGDVRSTTLLKELLSTGAVRQVEDGRLEPLQRAYIPQTMDENLVKLWGSVLADVGTTYLHNLTREGKVPTRFERAAVNDRVLASTLPEFREFLEQEGQAFLERVDAWLTAHEARRGAEQDQPVLRLGAGVYHLQD